MFQGIHENRPKVKRAVPCLYSFRGSICRFSFEGSVPQVSPTVHSFFVSMLRKRIRGVRRHFYRHQQAAAAPTVLNTERLARYGVDYAQLGMAPWFVHQRPPRAFRHLWVVRLVTDFYRWRAELARQYPAFYLAVWLFEPHFGHSQLVAAIAGRHAHYDDLFGEAGSFRVLPARDLPPEYRDVPGIGDLTWRRHADIAAFSPEEFADQGSETRRKPHWDATTVDGEAYIAVQVGCVWVGQAHPEGPLSHAGS